MLVKVLLVHLFKAYEYHCHYPLALLLVCFNATRYRWFTCEKESYAVLTASNRIYCNLATFQSFGLYTNHNNRIFLFYSLLVAPDMSTVFSPTPFDRLWASVCMATHTTISRSMKTSGLIYCPSRQRFVQQYAESYAFLSFFVFHRL